MSSQSHPTPTANTKANNQHNGTRKTSTLSVAGDQPTTSNDHRQTGRAEVKLNVYDMVSMANFNQYSSPVGFGVFHSGVEIYGSEYAYGGHDNSHSGVFDIAPRDVSVLGADSFKFRQTILLGYTDITEEDVKQIIDQLGVKFRGDKYHLLHQNCNHFTDALTKVSYVKQYRQQLQRLSDTYTNYNCLAGSHQLGSLWPRYTAMDQPTSSSELFTSLSRALAFTIHAIGTK